MAANVKKSKSNLVTISPLTSSCTACTASFYDFALTDPRTIVGISELFCEILDIDVDDLKKKLRLPGKGQPKLPFCPQCLLTLNEIRQMNRQLQNLGEEVSKLKDSLLATTISKISQCDEDDLNSDEPGSAISHTNVRFIHEHIRKHCNINGRRNSRNTHLSMPGLAFPPHLSRYADADFEYEDDDIEDQDDESMSGEYPLFVDIVEDPHNSASEPGIVRRNEPDRFNPLSPDNIDCVNQDDNSLNDTDFHEATNNNGERHFSSVRSGTSQPKRNGSLIKEEEGSFASENEDSRSGEHEDGEMSEQPQPRKRRKNAPGFSIRIVPPQDLQGSLLDAEMGGGTDEDSLLDGNFALGSQPIEIDFDDPRAQIRENFTMCPLCFKYTLREGADTEGHNCEEKSQTAHFQCGYCDLIAHTEKSLITHMKQHLSNSVQRKILSADSAHAKLLEVFAAVSGPYPCPYCESVFSRKSELIRGHIATQHGVRLKPYPCSVCGNAFRSKNDLQRHFRTHTGERPFSCGGCGRTFTRRHHLTTHESTCKCQRYCKPKAKAHALSLN